MMGEHAASHIFRRSSVGSSENLGKDRSMVGRCLVVVLKGSVRSR